MMRKVLISLLVLGASFACSDPAVQETGPRVLGLSNTEVVVGQTLGLYGRGLAAEDVKAARVTFKGTFTTDDGRTEDVNLTFGAVLDGSIEVKGETFDALRINRFGPFDNPFSRADRPGVFEGQIIAELEDLDGMVTRDASPRTQRLGVGPSVIVEVFAPLILNPDDTVEPVECGAPALRVMAGIPYYLQVRPVGIKAERFEYELNNINGVSGATRFEHVFERVVPNDALGESEIVVFNEVPAEQQFYVTGIRVLAYDAEGHAVETAMPISVHRPIEVRFDGTREVAERYEPVPVSGCIPGSFDSQVSYAESRTETRQRQVSVTLSQNWSRSEGLTQNQSWQEGISEGRSQSRAFTESEREEEEVAESYNIDYSESETNRVGFNTTDGESWEWNMSQGESNSEYNERANRIYGDVSGSVTVSGSAEGSIPGFAKVTGTASTTVGVRAGGAVGWSEGVSRTESAERGYNMGGSRSESQSFGSAVTEERGRSIGGAYALSQGRNRSVSEGERLDSARTWNVSEGVSDSEVVSESQEVAESLTLVDSRSDQTVQSFVGLIPRGKYGIFYRQTTRWVRRAEVVSYNLCGLARHMGELQFNDWTWAPDLAVAASCEERVPPSGLPPATGLIQPCGGSHGPCGLGSGGSAGGGRRQRPGRRPEARRRSGPAPAAPPTEAPPPPPELPVDKDLLRSDIRAAEGFLEEVERGNRKFDDARPAYRKYPVAAYLSEAAAGAFGAGVIGRWVAASAR
ncbi:MAG: hypothetical protein R3F60_17095 [bacterium]